MQLLINSRTNYILAEQRLPQNTKPTYVVSKITNVDEINNRLRKLNFTRLIYIFNKTTEL